MKKFLSVMLVLGLVSTAFALPTISGPSNIPALTAGTYTYTVTGVADDQDSGGVFADLATNKYYSSVLPAGVVSINLNNVLLMEGSAYRIGDVAGNFASVGTYYAGIDFTSSAGTAGAVLAGGWFTFDVVVDATIPVGSFRLDLTNGAYVDQPSNGMLVTVPEPMTIALLGLGGLFLRRRK